MELDITHMMDDDMFELSGSIAERGANAGAETWANSIEYAKAHPLLKDDEEREEARRFFKGFGAWDEEKIAAWSDVELEALVSQYIAGSIRETEGYDSFEEYQEANDGGNCIYKGDDGRWYAYIGE